MSTCPNCGWEHGLSMLVPINYNTFSFNGIIPIPNHPNHEKRFEYVALESKDWFSPIKMDSWFKNPKWDVDKFVPVEKRNFIPVSKGSAGSMIRTMSVKQHKIYRKKKNAERKRKFKRKFKRKG